MKKISELDYYKILGLLHLAKESHDVLIRIEKALQEITGDSDIGHCCDFVWCGETDAKSLLDKLNLEVEYG